MGWLQEALDRGVTIRKAVKFDKKNTQHFDDTYGGLEVIMYKDQPGIYYDIHGNVVHENIAKMAGFPVDKLAKSKLYREKMAAVQKKLRAELEDIQMEEEQIVLAEAGDWRVIALPGDRAKVIDKNDNNITPLPMPVAEAKALLRDLTGEPVPAKVMKTVSIAEKE